MQSTNRKYVTEIALFLVSQVLFFYGLKYVMSSLDPNKDRRKEAEAKARALLDRYGIKDLKLTDYEQVMAAELVHPDEIPTTFEDIGGLTHIIDDLKETVIYPLRYPDLFSQSNSLLSPPKGVLLYGPPGCGKTMLAKALAKGSGATFINMKVSTLTDKWYGESNKLVAGLFSLAYKIQPCVIFIDEIDSFLRERRSNDHEVTGMLKAEFMTLWDGLMSGANTRIMILGATNRPSDIDQAILRRMPKKFSIQPPQKEQRQSILKLILKSSKLAPDFDFDLLADITEGLSGSDLREICRDASMIAVKECIKLQHSESNQSYNGEPLEVRPLKTNDVLESAMRLGHIHSDEKLNNLVNLKLAELPEEPQD